MTTPATDVIYCDTSLLVAAVTPEPHSAAVSRWLAKQRQPLAASLWVDVEFASALALKVRMRALSAAHHLEALAQWRRLLAESLSLIPIEDRHYGTAGQIAGRPELNVRAGDALHLAIVADHGLALATLDRGMAAAGTVLGLRCEEVADA